MSGFSSDLLSGSAHSIPGLTLYDRKRSVRKVFDAKNSGPFVEVENSVIDSLCTDDLKCGVCWGLLDTTLATTCLHRFCSECLHRSLRMELGPKAHHECPSCRSKLASRRSSRPDTNFDRIVSLLTSSISGQKRLAVNEGMEDRHVRACDTYLNSNELSKKDFKNFRDLHAENVGKFRERRAQLNLDSISPRSGATGFSSGNLIPNTRKAMNATFSMLSDQMATSHSTAVVKACSSKVVSTLSASKTKVWLKLFPLPEVFLRFC
jgi:hypothetical protein